MKCHAPVSKTVTILAPYRHLVGNYFPRMSHCDAGGGAHADVMMMSPVGKINCEQLLRVVSNLCAKRD